MIGRSLLTLAFAVALPTVARAATGDVVRSFPSSFPSPDGLMWDGASLWATDCSFTRIDKVDPLTGTVVGSIDIPGVGSDELAWDGTAMWVSDHSATEMPGMGAPPPRLYRVDPVSQKVSSYLGAPGNSQYPMGVAWDGEAIWNVDTWDQQIYRLDPVTGAVLEALPAPAGGACGMTWDGACLWLTDASTDGLVYHVDPVDGAVIRSFAGPGGDGHQATGVAWDGERLWVHDEAEGRAKIYALEIEDITEGGRCAGAFQAQKDAGTPEQGAKPGPAARGADSTGSCALTRTRSHPSTLVLAFGALLLACLRGRRGSRGLLPGRHA